MKFSVVGLKEEKNIYYNEAIGFRELVESLIDALLYGATKIIIGKKELT